MKKDLVKYTIIEPVNDANPIYIIAFTATLLALFSKPAPIACPTIVATEAVKPHSAASARSINRNPIAAAAATYAP